MLKTVPPILCPQLMQLMLEMGHGDELILADANFPAAAIATRLVRADGHYIQPLLSAILKYFPLDTFIPNPVALMAVVAGDDTKPVIWEQYKRIIKSSGEVFSDFEYVERFAFYERAKNAYAIVATSEPSFYANIILKKGAIPPAFVETEKVCV